MSAKAAHRTRNWRRRLHEKRVPAARETRIERAAAKLQLLALLLCSFSSAAFESAVKPAAFSSLSSD